jgi:hypothetical protein
MSAEAKGGAVSHSLTLTLTLWAFCSSQIELSLLRSLLFWGGLDVLRPDFVRARGSLAAADLVLVARMSVPGSRVP